MVLHSTQAIVARDTHRFRVIDCGRRWGKTLLAIEEMKGEAIVRPAMIAYIATTYSQARDIAWERLKKEFGNAIIQANESRLELRVRTINGGETLITLRGWENIDTLRGLAFDFIVLDEVASMRNFWSIWQEIIRPTLTDRKGRAMFISTPLGFNHFYDLYNMETKDSDFKAFQFTTYDNPHIPVEEIDKARKELTEDRFAQEYLADFRKTEGLVYKEFDRKKHLYSELPDVIFDETVAGIDFGYVHPAAVLTVYIHGEEFYVDDEWYKTGKTDVQIAEYVAASDFNAVYPDPENQGAIRELENQKQNVRDVIKGKDSVKSGIQKVREMLKAGRLKVNKRCMNTIHEFETYTYDENVDDREKPIKENDHALDALRYVCMMKSATTSKSHHSGTSGTQSIGDVY